MIRLAILILVLLWSSPALAVTTRYASKAGTGAAPCTVNTENGACTVQRALLEMAAGDTLILKNGRYTGPAGMIAVSTTYHVNGTNALKITVQAETDGGVLLDGTNQNRPVGITGVDYWTLKGFNACCSNDTTVYVGPGADHIRFERVIAWDQQRTSGGIRTVYQTTNAYLEDVAAWGLGRKAFALQGDVNTTVNRALFVKYDVKDVCCAQDVVATWAYHSRGVKFYNVITAMDIPASASANVYSLFGPDHYVDDHGIITTIELHGNITYHVDGQNIGPTQMLARYGINPAVSTIPADNQLTINHKNNLTMRRVLASPAGGFDCPANGTSVICTQDNWTDSLGSLASGTHTTEGTAIAASAAPDLLRLQATSQPASGAWIKHRYTEAGVIDTGQALWPWPMNQRIFDALQTSGRGTRGLDGQGQRNLTDLILALAGSSLGPAPTPVLHLAFTSQPQSGPLGTPLQNISACIYNEDNVLQLGHVGTIAIALQSNPGAATLGGTTTATVTSGCGSWNNLTVNAGGTGYTLRVTSTGVTQADSNPFNITTVPITIVGDRVRMVP